MGIRTCRLRKALSIANEADLPRVSTRERGMDMFLDERQRMDMLEAAKPLMLWMKEHCHPHCAIHVDSDSAELTECIARVIK